MTVRSYHRIRSRGGLTFGPVYGWETYDLDCNTPFVSNFSDNTGLLVGSLTTTEDVVSPGYRKRSRSGEIILSPYSSVTENHEVSGEGWRARSDFESCLATHVHREDSINGPLYFTNPMLGGQHATPISLFSDSEMKSAINVAATQAWSQSNGNDAQILTDIGEMRQTLAMFRQPMSAIQPLLRAIKNSRKARLVSNVGQGALQTATGLWLQYRYGIRPLVSSVNSVVKALNEIRVKKRKTYRGKYNLNRSNSIPFDLPDQGMVHQCRESQSDVINIRAGILIEELVSLRTSLGVDASGMLALPWELVPFSFVADWFVNVGSFLTAISPALTKSPLGTWYTIQREQRRLIEMLGTTTSPGSGISVVRGATGTRVATFLSKSRVVGLPFPSLAFKPQALGNVFSDVRGLDSFALALQQLGRIFKA
jgi:hypothetical protein